MSALTDRHPDANELAAFIDGRLEGDAADQMTSHLDSCRECLEIVGGTMEIERGSDSPVADLNRPEDSTRRFDRRRWLPLSLAAGAALVSILGGWSVWTMRGADPVAPLIQAMSTVSERPIEARLDGFAWAPLVVLRSGNGERLDLNLLEARATAAEILEETRDGSEARQQHAAGIAALLAGDRQSAVEHLERATAIEPSSAPFWSDLAAARYESGQPAADRHALAQALGAADRALAASPDHPSALFNRALILEALDRNEEAAAAWETLQRVEKASRWGDEAANRAARLRERM